MKAHTFAQLLADLGVTTSYSRPSVSNDNPYSEAMFKTLKYRPDYPERFGSIEDARLFCREFFAWYNTEHHHSGIAMLTPESVHYNTHKEIIQARSVTLETFYKQHPERFVKDLPCEVWINNPHSQEKNKATIQNNHFHDHALENLAQQN